MLHPVLIMRLRLALIAVFVPPIAKAPFIFYVKCPMKCRKHVICRENGSYAIFAGINNAITAQKQPFAFMNGVHYLLCLSSLLILSWGMIMKERHPLCLRALVFKEQADNNV